MATSLADKIGTKYPNHFYKLEYRAMIEGILDYLRNHSETAKVSVEPNLVFHYNRNFYSLLSRLKQSSKYHWIIMRTTGLAAPDEDFSDLETIYVPSPDLISRITGAFKTTGILRM